MRWALVAFGMIVSSGWSLPAIASEQRLPLRVLYLGNEAKPRATEFVDFLRTRFEHVAARNRDGFDLDAADDFDVVLLDWSQSDTKSDRAVSPLGPRDGWSKPTVLLGSAGHLLPTPWKIIGGAG